MPTIEGVLDRRYMAILCIAAILILIAGVVFRPSKVPSPVRSEPETMRMQLMRQRMDVERRSLFYTSKAGELVTRAAEVRAHPDQFQFHSPAPGTTVLLVGTDAAGRTVWAASSTAGATKTGCGGSAFEEVTTTIAIPATLANGVAFDLDDVVSGIVIPCGGRLMLTDPGGFQAWTAERALHDDLLNCCGVEVDRDMTILSLTSESPLLKPGVRAGDRLLSINATPVTTAEELRSAMTSGEAISSISVQRAGAVRRLRARR